jgi:hypothetical protein
METIDYLYDLINKNEVILIGYRFSDERIKDEIISNLGRTKTIDLSSSFSMKSTLRDMKIDQVLNDQKKIDYLLLDINDIRTLFKERNSFTNEDIVNSRAIEETIYPIQNSVREFLRDSRNGKDISDIKLILTCPLNTTMSSSHKSGLDSFIGGSAPLFCADLGLMITQKNDDKIIKIIKNRNGDSDKIIRYDSIK